MVVTMIENCAFWVFAPFNREGDGAVAQRKYGIGDSWGLSREAVGSQGVWPGCSQTLQGGGLRQATWLCTTELRGDSGTERREISPRVWPSWHLSPRSAGATPWAAAGSWGERAWF